MPDLDKSQQDTAENDRLQFTIVVANMDRKHGDLLKSLLVPKYAVHEYSPDDFESDMGIIPSSTPKFFLGDFPYAKKVRSEYAPKFDRLGMHYGWTGNQAAAYVDTSMHGPEDYRALIKLNEELDTRIAGAQKPQGAQDFATQEWWDEVQKGADYAAAVVTGKIRDLQYKCLIKTFYLDGMPKFISR